MRIVRPPIGKTIPLTRCDSFPTSTSPRASQQASIRKGRARSAAVSADDQRVERVRGAWPLGRSTKRSTVSQRKTVCSFSALLPMHADHPHPGNLPAFRRLTRCRADAVRSKHLGHVRSDGRAQWGRHDRVADGGDILGAGDAQRRYSTYGKLSPPPACNKGTNHEEYLNDPLLVCAAMLNRLVDEFAKPTALTQRRPVREDGNANAFKLLISEDRCFNDIRGCGLVSSRACSDAVRVRLEDGGSQLSAGGCLLASPICLPCADRRDDLVALAHCREARRPAPGSGAA